ncbi:hypothetical protein [Rhizobium sp. MHM7A]|uniref:hypothetical protein n=1 Tax=Rhizobium sp. MHM7A TaxID=2583233 RepID=UPI0011063C8A|nr:hypothetical protein [Rhizobium sp. MHM7A]TLX16625.1 hypothetical protein FFR93_04595 [Rhizobium sp. MHM7A]
MRVIIDFPVRAKGRPKGHSGTKVIVGHLSEEFNLDANDDPMAKAIELKSQYATIEYLQNGDGHFYKKVGHGRGQQDAVRDGHHFSALYNSEGNPFIDTMMRDIRQEFRNRNEAEINKDYFPKALCERNRYSHDRLLNLATAVIEHLELRNDEFARATTREAVSQYIVSQGSLYQRLPEPSFGVSLNDKKIEIKQWAYGTKAEFEKVLLSDKTTLAFFNMSDLERAQDFARELADEVGGTYDGNDNLPYTVEHYSPITSYADELTLYRLGKQIEESVADNMKRGTTSSVIDKLLDWNNEALGMLRDLSIVMNRGDWMTESPALERIIGNCLEYDRVSRSQTFTKPVRNNEGVSFDFTLAYSQWQMREFNAPSLRR